MVMVRPPIMLYDNRCSLCSQFARAIDRFAGGRLTIVGHYTADGSRIRDAVLDPSATEMFWVVGERAAYGGRAALVPLIYAMATARNGLGIVGNQDECGPDACTVFARSASLMTRSKKIVYDSPATLL